MPGTSFTPQNGPQPGASKTLTTTPDLNVPDRVESVLNQRATSRASGNASQLNYVHDGAACDRKSGAGCFLDAAERARLIQEFGFRIEDVKGSYKDAIKEVELDVMLEKEPQMSWYASLLLDVLSFTVVGLFARTLTSLRSAALSKIEEISNQAEIAGNLSHWSHEAQLRVRQISSQRLTAGAQLAVGAAKEPARRHLNAQLAAPVRSDKAEKRNYLTLLAEAANVGFAKIRQQAPAYATDDAELFLLVDAFDITRHPTSMYSSLLSEKLSAYMQSGVPDIGRKEAKRSYSDSDFGPKEGVMRDTRVVWHQYVSGHPPDLVFERQDGRFGPKPTHEGLFGFRPTQTLPMTFGPVNPITDAPETSGRLVPADFIEAAVQRHEATWGTKPATVVVDDTEWTDPTHVVYTHMNNARAKRASTLSDVTRNAMDAQLTKPAGSGDASSQKMPSQSAQPHATPQGIPSATDVWNGRNNPP